MVYIEISSFYHRYKKEKCVIGKTAYGNDIFAFHTGSMQGRQIIATYAIHAREYITSKLAMEHLKRPVGCGCWVIPLLNPDGVFICQTSDPLWKANGRGVDLNCNFDADWGMGRNNKRHAGPSDFIGAYPFSEKETQALRDFTLQVKPFATLSFHTKGEEIYWEFNGKGDRRGAEILARSTGYRIRFIRGSVGGYKDWCIQKLGIPAYTVECGEDALSHPIRDVKKLKKSFKALQAFSCLYKP